MMKNRISLLCALLLARVGAYTLSGIHMTLALFNLLPLRLLDGGRAMELLLSWRFQPILAGRVLHTLSCLCLGVLLAACAALQSAVGIQLPLLVLQAWFILCWCLETGIVKQSQTR